MGGGAGTPRGFAFVAYEDQRSTTLAVDNLSGARVTGRTIRVEHVDNYKRKKAEVSAHRWFSRLTPCKGGDMPTCAVTDMFAA